MPFKTSSLIRVGMALALSVTILSMGPRDLSFTGLPPTGSDSSHAPSQLAERLVMHRPAPSLMFTENRGQWADSVLYCARTGEATMWFTQSGVYYEFARSVSTIHEVGQGPIRPSGTSREECEHAEHLLVKACFVGANPKPQVVGEEPLGARCNFFSGSGQTAWRTGVPNYEAIRFEEIYPGIDLKYYGNSREMEYDFIVLPGADYTQIRLRYDGARSVAVTDRGELMVETKWGRVTERPPLVYQATEHGRSALHGAYRLVSDNTFGFTISGNVEPALALVIDPVLTYSSFLGGSGNDHAWSVEVDNSGHMYVAGFTTSTDFPTENPFHPDYAGGGYDVFVSKLSADGATLMYSTYIGGAGDDTCFALAVDDQGCAYIAGPTTSADFPTQNAYDDTYNGGQSDIFVAKLSPEGNSLVYSTFLGGSGTETDSRMMAVDQLGYAYIAGATGSSDFPTLNAYDGGMDGVVDIFVSKLSPAGDQLIFSTFLGGTGSEYPLGMDLDPAGCVYVTGITTSSNYPTRNAYDNSYNGNWDCVVTKFSPNGDSLRYSTYIGGNSSDGGHTMAVDDSGHAYIGGAAFSTNFPTRNAYDNTFNGNADGIVLKLSQNGDTLEYSTFLGGSNEDAPTAIAVDDSGRVVVVGETKSGNFPTVNPYDASYAGGYDVFVSIFSNTGGSLLYSTYLGSSTNDEAYGIALDGAGSVYVAGWTPSANFPIINAYDATPNGGVDAFVAIFAPCQCPGFCDLNRDDSINPFDVVSIVNFVYKSTDQRQQIPNCPAAGNSNTNGDWNCDGAVNPVDVVQYVNYVYKGMTNRPPCSPCDCASYPTGCPPWP